MNSRNKVFIIGGLVGSALGVLAAWLYVEASGEEEAPQAIPTGKMVKLGLSVMEVLRQVTALSEQQGEKGRKRGWLRKK